MPLNITTKTTNTGTSWYIPEGGRMRRTISGGKPSMSYPFGIYARVAGLRNVERALYRKIGKMTTTYKGLQAAAEIVHRNTEKIPPLVPVSNEEKEKHLRDTWFAKVLVTNTGGALEMGYTAPYAVYVHEMTSPPYGNVQWTRPGSGPQWFMKAIQRDRLAMFRIISLYARRAMKQ